MEYDTLVLGSSFYNEFVLLGSLLALDEKINLKNITNYVSVSTSSIISLLLNLDFTINEIILFFYENKLLINLYDLMTNKYEKNFQSLKIKTKLSSLIETKIRVIPTMYELYLLTGKKIYFLVHNNENIDFISYETMPNLTCIDAILYSINSNKIYEIPPSILTEDLYDATLLNPFPIDFIEESDKAIGLYIKPNLELKDNKDITIQKLINYKLDSLILNNKNCKIYFSNLNKIQNTSIQNLIHGYHLFTTI